MKRTVSRTWLSVAMALICSVTLGGVAASAQSPPKPKRINRAIELLSQGQPIYYTGSHSGTEGTFEQGKKDAQTSQKEIRPGATGCG